jgi:hypothetical protein
MEFKREGGLGDMENCCLVFEVKVGHEELEAIDSGGASCNKELEDGTAAYLCDGTGVLPVGAVEAGGTRNDELDIWRARAAGAASRCSRWKASCLKEAQASMNSDIVLNVSVSSLCCMLAMLAAIGSKATTSGVRL